MRKLRHKVSYLDETMPYDELQDLNFYVPPDVGINDLFDSIVDPHSMVSSELHE